jgi:hypothetical protein
MPSANDRERALNSSVHRLPVFYRILASALRFRDREARSGVFHFATKIYHFMTAFAEPVLGAVDYIECISGYRSIECTTKRLHSHLQSALVLLGKKPNNSPWNFGFSPNASKH